MDERVDGELPYRIAERGAPASWYVAVPLGFTAFYLALFAPFLGSGRLLAPYDAALMWVPKYLGPRTLWTPDLFSGYPELADPQGQAFYPPAALLSSIGGTWNAFVILAYVTASSLAFAWVHRATRSSVGAAVAGITFGTSGFMAGHLTHSSLIHSACWLPLAMLALDLLRERAGRREAALLGLAVALTTLGGHPQVLLHAALAGGPYAAVRARGARDGALRYLASCTIGALLGLGVAAVVLVPAAELASLSVRAATTLRFAVSWALVPEQLVVLVFPLLFGADAGAFGRYGFSTVEQSGYVGLLPLMLAPVALAARRNQVAARFWGVTALLAVLLSLGASTPLAGLAFRLPLIGHFRYPGRYFLVLALASSLLAGAGIARLAAATDRDRARAVLALCAGLAAFLAATAAWARNGGLAGGRLLPPAAVAGMLPTAWSAALLLPSVLFWSRAPASRLRGLLLCAAVAADLGKVARGIGMGDEVVLAAGMEMPPALAPYREELLRSGQRLTPLRGVTQPGEAAPPNRSRLWSVPSLSGYTSLRIERYARLLGMIESGAVSAHSLLPVDRSLDLVALRYLLVPRGLVVGESEQQRHGIGWRIDDMEATLGTACGRRLPSSLSFPVAGLDVTAVAMVTSLDCAARIPDGTELLAVNLHGEGPPRTLHLAAGRDSADRGWDRPGAAAAHARARIFEDRAAVDPAGRAYLEHRYLFVQDVDVRGLRRLELAREGPAALVRVAKISVRERGTGRWVTLCREGANLAAPRRWRRVGELEQTVVFENLQAMPRAWLASRVERLPEAAILKTITNSRLPDGRSFDPRSLALVEEPLSLPDAGTDAAARADVEHVGDAELRVRTSSRHGALLVLADVHYPGWRAEVDGASAPIVRTDYALRGVVVPAGQHLVTLRYRPATVALGGMISLGCVAALALLARRPAGRRGREG